MIDTLRQIEQIVDCSKFNEFMGELMVYMKMTVDDAEIEYQDIFNWMGLVDSGEYDDAEIEEDITNNGSWNEEDMGYIKKRLSELAGMLKEILYEFEKKTGVIIYFEYNHEDYISYFDFNPRQVLNVILELHDLKNKMNV